MKYTLCLIAALIIVISSCGRKPNNKSVTSQNRSIDTILSVDSLDFLESTNPDTLTKELSHKTLLEYFSKKGYFAQEKVSLDSLLTYPVDNEEPMCIMFDTLYTTHLNKDRILDGIVTYWQMPCGASGHCWQPHRAMIVSINKKYTIINTDFIPKSYLIDSITTNYDKTFINGKIYDCGNHEYIKTYRALIEN